jgi:GNAT superfamily N-acetyltransferase
MSFEAINRLTDQQIEDLYALYQSEWWTKGRHPPDIRRMLQHSDVIIGYCDIETKRLIAFARVLTDYVYKALIFDVIVDVTYRSAGLGRALMDAIIEHPDLRSIRHFELYCLPEMVPFYQKWGFMADLGDLRFMRRGNTR